jgi:hypothetical protein
VLLHCRIRFFLFHDVGEAVDLNMLRNQTVGEMGFA